MHIRTTPYPIVTNGSMPMPMWYGYIYFHLAPWESIRVQGGSCNCIWVHISRYNPFGIQMLRWDYIYFKNLPYVYDYIYVYIYIYIYIYILIYLCILLYAGLRHQKDQKDTLDIKENPWPEYLHPNNTQGLRPEPAMAQKYKNKTKRGIYNPSEMLQMLIEKRQFQESRRNPGIWTWKRPCPDVTSY